MEEPRNQAGGQKGGAATSETQGQERFLPQTGKSKDHPQEGRPLPGATTEVPESGRGCSPHLLTPRPEVREEDGEREASLSFSLKPALPSTQGCSEAQVL